MVILLLGWVDKLHNVLWKKDIRLFTKISSGIQANVKCLNISRFEIWKGL